MNEQISALTDDEVAAEDMAHILTWMQSNRHAATAWSEYHLIGDVMRGTVHAGADSLTPDDMLGQNFKQSLMQKLALEPTVLSPNAADAQYASPASEQHHKKVPVVWSIAASFAAALVVGWMALQQTQTSQELASVEVAQASVPAEYLAAHQVSAPSASSYYIQPASYSE